MTGTDYTRPPQLPSTRGAGGKPPPPIVRFLRGGGAGGFFNAVNVIALVLALLFVYGAYFWFVRREVVPLGKVLVLMKKDGSRSLPGDQVIIPRPPDRNRDA